VIFRLTAGLLSRRHISVLAATVALGASSAMLGTVPASAVTTGAAHTAQSSSGLLGQTTTANVPATTSPTSSGMPGVDTGIDLAPGQAAMITATGTASCNAPDPISECVYLNANGGGSAAVASPPFMDPSAPAYSLDGEVGSSPLTFIGTGQTTVDGPGELRLGYNDEIGDYFDNGGNFTVTIQTCSLYSLPILGPPLCSLLG
jgi:hypothetical protein